MTGTFREYKWSSASSLILALSIPTRTALNSPFSYSDLISLADFIVSPAGRQAVNAELSQLVHFTLHKKDAIMTRTALKMQMENLWKNLQRP